MGSRGSSAGGGSVPNGWQIVDYVYGVAVLRPNDSKQSLSLPRESKIPNISYLLYGRNGVFKQLRVFGEDKIPKFDIDYHMKDGEMSLYKHIYIDGVRQKEHIMLTPFEYDEYSKFLKR